MHKFLLRSVAGRNRLNLSDLLPHSRESWWGHQWLSMLSLWKKYNCSDIFCFGVWSRWYPSRRVGASFHNALIIKIIISSVWTLNISAIKNNFRKRLCLTFPVTISAIFCFPIWNLFCFFDQTNFRVDTYTYCTQTCLEAPGLVFRCDDTKNLGCCKAQENFVYLLSFSLSLLSFPFL